MREEIRKENIKRSREKQRNTRKKTPEGGIEREREVRKEKRKRKWGEREEKDKREGRENR